MWLLDTISDTISEYLEDSSDEFSNIFFSFGDDGEDISTDIDYDD